MSQENDWEPSESDLAWCANLLRVGATTWGTSNGIYEIDHTSKTMTLVQRLFDYEPHLHERNVKGLRQAWLASFTEKEN